ncbi:hypothetical protein D3C76_1059150 [compost metagenome]
MVIVANPRRFVQPLHRLVASFLKAHLRYQHSSEHRGDQSGFTGAIAVTVQRASHGLSMTDHVRDATDDPIGLPVFSTGDSITIAGWAMPYIMIRVSPSRTLLPQVVRSFKPMKCPSLIELLLHDFRPSPEGLRPWVVAVSCLIIQVGNCQTSSLSPR